MLHSFYPTLEKKSQWMLQKDFITHSSAQIASVCNLRVLGNVLTVYQNFVSVKAGHCWLELKAHGAFQAWIILIREEKEAIPTVVFIFIWDLILTTFWSYYY